MSAAEEMAKKSGQLDAPLIIARLNGKDNIIVGFDEKRLRELLRI